MIQFLGTNIQEYFSKKPRYNFFKTLKYILYKFVFDDLKLQSFQLEFPWLNFAAIEFINKFTDKKENLHVFEYGSGGSTIFFLKPQIFLSATRLLRGAKVITYFILANFF